jgi:hypothetical protein
MLMNGEIGLILKRDIIIFSLYIAPNDDAEKRVERFFTSTMAHMYNNDLNFLQLFDPLHSYLKIFLAIQIAIAI